MGGLVDVLEDVLVDVLVVEVDVLVEVEVVVVVVVVETHSKSSSSIQTSSIQTLISEEVPRLENIPNFDWNLE
jgi:hypothetical protein